MYVRCYTAFKYLKLLKMKNDILYEKLKSYSFKDAISTEQKDEQFIALKDLYLSKIINDEKYLFIIIANAIVCYQLSGEGEQYWQEFAIKMKNVKIDNFDDVQKFFDDFLPNSKNNKRLIEIKLKRIAKLDSFFEVFFKDANMYYRDMNKFNNDLAKVMQQKKDAKTIVLAVKMFSYGARNVFDYIEYFPTDIMIPIDSRLKNLYFKYCDAVEKQKESNIKKYYINLSRKLDIPLLHLDALLWVNYQKFINLEK